MQQPRTTRQELPRNFGVAPSNTIYYRAKIPPPYTHIGNSGIIFCKTIHREENLLTI